ncbi:hypothetical protein H4R19_000422 [Coemansia spiralis]|nr:hypothetical protein H4R19_000422 [Coemansia spiralis]
MKLTLAALFAAAAAVAPVTAGGIAGVRIGEPGVRVGKPGVRIGEPGIRVGEPGIRYGEPGMLVGEPGIGFGGPGVGIGGPGIGFGGPGIGMGELGVGIIEEHRGVPGIPLGHHIDWNRVNDALNLDNDALNQQRNIINLLDRASYQLRSLRGTSGEHIHAEHAAAINEQRQVLNRVMAIIGRLRQFRH